MSADTNRAESHCCVFRIEVHKIIICVHNQYGMKLFTAISKINNLKKFHNKAEWGGGQQGEGPDFLEIKRSFKML